MAYEIIATRGQIQAAETVPTTSPEGKVVEAEGRRKIRVGLVGELFAGKAEWHRVTVPGTVAVHEFDGVANVDLEVGDIIAYLTAPVRWQGSAAVSGGSEEFVVLRQI